MDPEAAASLEDEINSIKEQRAADEYLEDAGDPEEYLRRLRELDPEAAANLKIEYDKIQSESDRFEQEMLDHQADMKKFAEEREVWKQKRLADKRERESDLDRLDTFIAELRSHLKFDSNGKVIGIKEDSIFNVSERPSALPSGTSGADVPADISIPSDEALESSGVQSASPGVASTTTAPSLVDDPVLWRENVKTEMAGLHNGFYEKYPDVMIRPHLSDTEYQTFFPDASSRQQLDKRTEALQTEYADRIRAVLNKTPKDRQTTLLEMAREALSTQWNSDFSESVLDQLR